MALLIPPQLLHSHHVPVRAREVRRKRKNNFSDDSGADSDQDCSVTPGPSPSVVGTVTPANRPSKRLAFDTTERHRGIVQMGTVDPAFAAGRKNQGYDQMYTKVAES